MTETRSDSNLKNASHYCDLIVYLHYTFAGQYKNLDAAMATIVAIVQRSNSILKALPLKPDVMMMQHQISKIIYIPQGDDSIIDENDDPDDMLSRINNYNAKKYPFYCQSVIFVGISFGSVLGIAYVGNDAGTGICGNDATFIISSIGANNLLSYPSLLALFLHELGHTLGCNHDPTSTCTDTTPECPMGDRAVECSGSYVEGAFIMSSRVSPHIGKNGLTFSPCSIKYIRSLYEVHLRRKCFQEFKLSLCGNGVVEQEEECDMGQKEDKCCDKNCKLKPDMVCSQSNGACCDDNCQIKPKNTECERETECRFASLCSGNSPSCSLKQDKPDATFCFNHAAICSEGECNVPPCIKFKKIDCLCNDPDYLCSVCCKDSADGICRPIKYRMDSQFRNAVPGTPCKNYSGYCNKAGKCLNQVLEATIPQKWGKILKGEGFSSIVEFLNHYQNHLLGAVGIYIFTLFILASRLSYDKEERSNQRLSRISKKM